MKPTDFDPDIWRRGEAHARRLTIEYEVPWWIEFFEGIVGYLVIAVLFLLIIVFWPQGKPA